MSVVNGNVKLRVELSGDSASATRAVKEVKSEIDSATKSSGLLSDSTGQVKDRIDGLKGSVKGVNAVREGFENLRGNIGFVIGAVTGLVGIIGGAISEIVAFAEANDKAAQAAKRWEEGEDRRKDAIKRAMDLLYDFNLSPQEEALRSLREEIALAERTAEALKGDYEELLPVLGKLRELRSLQAGIENQIARAQERQADALAKIVARARAAAPQYVPSGNPFLGTSTDPDLTVDTGKKPTGGGGRSQADDSAERFAREVARQRAMVEALSPGTGGGNIAIGGTAANDNAPLKQAATDAEVFADALGRVADAVRLVSETMPEFGSALSEIQGITDKLVKGQMELGPAIAAGATAIVANAAKSVGGVRAEAGVRAAYEFAMGWATLETPPISAGHFLASGLLTAVAAGAGGAGASGGSSRGSSSSPRSTRVSTATTLGEAPVVQNINAPWFGGLQEGGAYLWEVYGRAAGTGWGARAA